MKNSVFNTKDYWLNNSNEVLKTKALEYLKDIFGEGPYTEGDLEVLSDAIHAETDVDFDTLHTQMLISFDVK